MGKRLDVLIVGGGVIGSAIAYELSKFRLDVCLIEKESDVCFGASKANSGVVHSGIYSQPGSQKAQFCVKGNQMFSEFTNEIGVELKRIGKLVVARTEDEIPKLKKLKEAGEKNHVPGLEFIEKGELEKKEPNITGLLALFVPSAAIVSPYELTISLAENAKLNGVDFLLDEEVVGITQKNGAFKVKTNRSELESQIVINCAGLNCDSIANMVGIEKHRVYPCRGEYLVLDKTYSDLISHLIYPPPTNGSGGLGVHLTLTMDGNILVGPTANYIDDKEGTKTTKDALQILRKGALSFLKKLPKDAVINTYSGIRCKLTPEGCENTGDFIIEEDKDVAGFINLMGIESPGLSASPAIAKKVMEIVRYKTELKSNTDFMVHKVRPRFHNLDTDAKSELISSNKKQGHLICRCENVTEKEIIDALENPLEVRTLSGIKYRSRATMGRCQGGFCKARIIRILEDKYHPDLEDITKKGKGSYLFPGRTKDLRKHDKKEC
jgi:glycerol-3-phosphate dehydrogenase